MPKWDRGRLRLGVGVGYGCLCYQKKGDRNEERRKREEERRNLAFTRPLNSGRTTPSPARKSRRKVTVGRGMQELSASQPSSHCQEWGQAQKDGKDTFQSLGQLPFPYFPLIQSGQAHCQATHMVSIRTSCLSLPALNFPLLG